jgi:hypothetical protein
MVERQLPKLDVAGSIPVARSKFLSGHHLDKAPRPEKVQGPTQMATDASLH